MKYMNNHYGRQRIFGKHKLNLQLFTDEGDEGDEQNDPSGDGKDDDAKGKSEEHGGDENKKTFSRDELGAIVANALKKEREKWDAEQLESQNEAKKYEKLSDAEKKEYDEKKKDNRIAELERQIARGEIAKTVAKNLADEGINASGKLVDFLTCDTADETDEVVKEFKEITDGIRAEIKAEFEKKFAKYIPLDGSSSGSNSGAYGASLAKGADAPKKNTYFKNS